MRLSSQSADEWCACPACSGEPEETHCWSDGRFVRTWWTDGVKAFFMFFGRLCGAPDA